MNVGDVAERFPLEKLGGMLRSFYLHNGYTDVEIENRPVLDHDRALVTYHLAVIPGPVYHLRSLKVEKLNGEQESKARGLLDMKPGDIYSDEPITDLYRKIANDPLFKGYHFSYEWKRDKKENVIDLSLEFYKESGESSVTIK
jgi:outer membrane protein assembly factor BamA